jgi:hypothetical protein
MTKPEHTDDLDLEAPEADAAEQAMDAEPGEQDDDRPSRGMEVPEWDAAEQSRSVRFDDEYR